MAVSEEEFQRLQHEVAALRAENEEKGTQLAVKIAQASFYKEDFELERRDREKAHVKLETLRQESEMTINGLMTQFNEAEELREARDSLQVKDIQIAQLSEQVERLTTKAAKLERQNTALTQEVGKLRVTLHHPTPAADELPGLRRELEKLGNECRHLRSDNKAVYQEKLKLAAHNEHLEKTVKDLQREVQGLRASTIASPAPDPSPARAKVKVQHDTPQMHQATSTTDLEKIRLQLKQNFERQSRQKTPPPPLHMKKSSSEDFPHLAARVQPPNPQGTNSQTDKEMPYAKGSSYPRPLQASLQPEASQFDRSSVSKPGGVCESTISPVGSFPRNLSQREVPVPKRSPGSNNQWSTQRPSVRHSIATAAPSQSILGPPQRRTPFSISPEVSDFEDDEEDDLLPGCSNQLEIDLECEIEEVAADVLQTSVDRRTNLQVPLDPNLVCPECGKEFRMFEIQKLKKHVENICRPTQRNIAPPDKKTEKSQKINEFGYVNQPARPATLTAKCGTCSQQTAGGSESDDSEEEDIYLSGNIKGGDSKESCSNKPSASEVPPPASGGGKKQHGHLAARDSSHPTGIDKAKAHVWKCE